MANSSIQGVQSEAGVLWNQWIGHVVRKMEENIVKETVWMEYTWPAVVEAGSIKMNWETTDSRSNREF